MKPAKSAYLAESIVVAIVSLVLFFAVVSAMREPASDPAPCMRTAVTDAGVQWEPCE